MVIEQALFHIVDCQQMAFEKKFYELSDTFRNAQGCEKFKLIRGIEDNQKYILQIHWIDLKTHTDVFMKTDEFKQWFTAMKPFLASKIEMQHFENTLV
ncbi:antibiotic biosynthesis monooxygenase [Acinetobacter sp. NyZ410]|uniref:antibiotic biosynthesis monooxygenase family protein n=1 Tax=Acinetobacter sp. NyZ410 TaxID=2929509 RepID=UPI001FB96228|nr:antibiotic biosynthesis monooxygenase [Acinetobacter sp. NyZ410]UOH18366.1 antibiotic biosynthesis monooxygenase [Acinetobacter sp. NyZ410]